MEEKNIWLSENVQTEILKTIKTLSQEISNFNFDVYNESNSIFLKLNKLDNLYKITDSIIDEISKHDDLYEKYIENIHYLIITLLCIVCERNKEEIEREKINNVLKEIGSFLISKNKKYGNAALNPCRIFSTANKMEQLYVRCDDKLNRIKNRQNDEDEDPIKDLIGYLILIDVCHKLANVN